MSKKVQVNDSFQSGYEYELAAPVGKDFHPDFKPQLTPQEMLELGVFGGAYFGADRIPEEFPSEWFKQVSLALTSEPSKECNYFGVSASKSLEYWQKKGWIREQDPRGWFQWYCRYYLGRRTDDDERQIKRWVAFRRHAGQIRANCDPGDDQCRPRQRQALLHWAYDSRRI